MYQKLSLAAHALGAVKEQAAKAKEKLTKQGTKLQSSMSLCSKLASQVQELKGQVRQAEQARVRSQAAVQSAELETKLVRARSGDKARERLRLEVLTKDIERLTSQVKALGNELK